MKFSRFSKMLRGQETCFQRRYFENTAEDASTTEKDNPKHQEKGRMFHKMKHGHFKRRRMEHHFRKHHRFGHGHFKNSNDSDMEHDFNNDIRMRHGRHMHHGMEHNHHLHHGMPHDHHMHYGMEHGHHRMRHDHHGMEHGHHMQKRMKHGFSKFHRMKHSHMKLHKMARLFRHHKMKSACLSMEQGDSDKHHEMGEVRQMYPGKASKEFENVQKSPEGGKMNTAGEIRTYPSKSVAQVTTENNKFQICMNTSSYQPEEICVKIVKGKIEISAIHESVDDDLYEFHEMYQSFTLPENVDPENVSSRLESDGKLIVEAPINSTEASSNVRDIPVISEE